MVDAEISLIFELTGPLELGVSALLLDKLIYKGLVRGLGEPALFIQQGQHSWRVCLKQQSQDRQLVGEALVFSCRLIHLIKDSHSD